MGENRSPEELTLALFAGFGEGIDGTAAAIEEFFAPDCVWINSGSVPPLRGPVESVALMRQVHEATGLDATRIEMKQMACDGDRVFTERIDYVDAADGTLLLELPIAGVLEWEDGKLKSWREYFDPTGFQALTGG
jgi:limonene-1,2-epoxide hydrolase